MNQDPQSQIPRSLYLAMIFQFAIGGAVIPFITILLRDRGLDFGQIGTVFLISSSTSLVFPFIWGMLADRYLPIDRVFTLVNLLAAAALFSLALQREFWGLLVSFTCFCACFIPTLTLINALSFHHLQDPRQQFGVLRSWGSVGWILPSLPISLWLIKANQGQFDFVLYLGIGLSLLMAAVTFLLPHTPPGARSSPSHVSGRVNYWAAVQRLLRNSNYVTLLVSFFLMSASFSIFVLYSPAYLEDLGVSRAWIGPIQCIAVTVEVILFRWKPGFLRTWSYPASILIGCLSLLVRHLIFAYSANPWLLGASYIFAGMVIVFYHIGVSILVNTLAGVEVRATAQTLLALFASGLGPMFGNWAAGRIAVWANQDLRPVFLFAAIFAGLASLLIFFRRHKLQQASQ